MKKENIVLVKKPISKRFQDLIGKQFGRLTVIDYAGKMGTKNYWICECSCSEKNTIKVRSDSLKSGTSKSCGCYMKERTYETQFKDLTNQKFGKLLILDEIKIRKNKKTLFLCRCDCGREVQMFSTNLINNSSKSCLQCANKNNNGWRYDEWNNHSKNSKCFDSFKVYIIKCWNENEEFYKIGKTYLKIENRFNSKNKMPYDYEIIKIIKNDDANFISKLEKRLHKIYKKFQYNPKLKFAGMTECFSHLIPNTL